MRRLTGKLTYANVVSTICLFLLLGGGAAVAAGLGKNTVGPKQLKKNAVTAAKIKNAAITTAKLGDASVTTPKLGDGSVANAKIVDNAVNRSKIADNAVNGAKVEDSSLTGADINQSTLTGVRASNVYALAIDNDPNCSPTLPAAAGVSTERIAAGVCRITFPFNVATCTAQATSNVHGAGEIQKVAIGARGFQLFSYAKSPNSLDVYSYLNQEIASLKFDLAVIC